jgi:tetratricopeptide (TPR) repeat protein
MKRKLTYSALLIVFFAFTAFVVMRYAVQAKAASQTNYPLKERPAALAQLPEWPSIKEKANKLYRNLLQQPNNIKSALALASLYIQEGRATGDYNYYNKAALKYINDVLAIDVSNFDAMVLKAIVQLSQHHFADALNTAAKAKEVNPYNAFIYGIMVDGNVELGNYKLAVENCDKMMDIRPDIRSYSRVAYLREIYGDYAGAIEAMKMAVDAGGEGDEPTEWTRIQLARLYQITGELRTAEMYYTIARQNRPGYPYALQGLAQVATARKDYSKAIELYQLAINSSSDFAIKEDLAKLYLHLHQNDKASALLKDIEKELTSASSQDPQNTNHHAGKDLAYIYLLLGDYANAEKYVMKEYNARPDNNDVNEAVAWVLYKKGDTEAALRYIERTFQTGSKNPVLLCHAAAIYAATNQARKAKAFLQEALQKNPEIDIILKDESEKLLMNLNKM